MSEMTQEDIYMVVMNGEEQYSIWPAKKMLPNGWKLDGFEGTKSQCLEHIKKVWVDMRPLSARN